MAEVKVEHLAMSPHHREPPIQAAAKQSPKHQHGMGISISSEPKDEQQNSLSVKSKEELAQIDQTSDSQLVHSSASPNTNEDTQVSSDVKLETSNSIINNDDSVLSIIENERGTNDDEMKLDKIKSGSSQQEEKGLTGGLQQPSKEPRFEELIVDGFAICAFQTWEELQDEVNEQIAIKKANDSKNAVVSVAKNPRKNNKTKPKVSTTSDDVSSNSKTGRTKRKDKEKSPSKRPKKNLESQPPSTCESMNATNTNENSKHRKDKNVTPASTSQKRGAEEGAGSSKGSENKEPDPKIRNSNSQPSPQVHNQHDYSQSSNHYRRESSITEPNASLSPSKESRATPFDINKANDNHYQPHHTGQYAYPSYPYAQYPGYNFIPGQPTHEHSKIPQNEHQRPMFKPPEHTATPASNAAMPPHPSLNQSTASNQSAQHPTTYPQYYPYQQPTSSTPSYPYNSLPYPYNYQQHYAKQSQQTPPGYAQSSSYPAPPYQHFYPPAPPNLPHSQYLPYPGAGQPNQQPHTLPGQQAIASQYQPSSVGSGAYPPHYGPPPPYVMTDTTISRQTSIIPTYPPVFNYHQTPAAISTATTNRFSHQHSPSTLSPYNQAAAAAAMAAAAGAQQPTHSNQIYNTHHSLATNRGFMEFARSYQSGPNHMAATSYSSIMKSLPPATAPPQAPHASVSASGSTPFSSTTSPITSLQPLSANPYSHINGWPGTALDHQWAVAGRLGAASAGAGSAARPPPPPSFVCPPPQGPPPR